MPDTYTDDSDFESDDELDADLPTEPEAYTDDSDFKDDGED